MVAAVARVFVLFGARPCARSLCQARTLKFANGVLPKATPSHLLVVLLKKGFQPIDSDVLPYCYDNAQAVNLNGPNGTLKKGIILVSLGLEPYNYHWETTI